MHTHAARTLPPQYLMQPAPDLGTELHSLSLSYTAHTPLQYSPLCHNPFAFHFCHLHNFAHKRRLSSERTLTCSS
ncbi:hypothetical protein XELAEV_18001941mg [Xenopus laevis]|nr:hypothetical protein XELAEV_18001941mg [Xenopus laevis]